MKVTQIFGLGLLCLLPLVPLHAAPITCPATGFVFNFDENGNGTFCPSGGTLETFNGALHTDPSHSGIANALIWNFGSVGVSLNNGDVLINDPGSGTSDLLRFTNSDGASTGTGDLLIFYSGDIHGGLLADTGLPSNIHGSTVGATEDATGHFTYVGGTNSDHIYNGFSGAVPEPGTVATLGIGLAGLYVAIRRRVA